MIVKHCKENLTSNLKQHKHSLINEKSTANMYISIFNSARLTEVKFYFT